MPHHKHYINVLTGFHLSLATALLYKPSLILEQTAVVLLGEAMGLPPAPKSLYSTAGFGGLCLLLFSLTDLIVQLQADEMFKRQFWRVQAPFRATFFMALTMLLYLTKPARADWHTGTWEVQNRLVFTWTFVEVVAWYFIFGELRDEGKRLVRMKKEDGAVEGIGL